MVKVDGLSKNTTEKVAQVTEKNVSIARPPPPFT